MGPPHGGPSILLLGGKFTMFERFRENWVRPALFFGNNPISLAGGAITTASGVTMIGYWVVELFGRHTENPYTGDYLLPHSARSLRSWPCC